MTSSEPALHPQATLFVEAFQGGGFRVGQELPYHLPGCYGCGPGNEHGLGLRARAAAGDAVEADYVFAERFQGAPGVVHGGAVATLVDDLYGMLLVRLLVPAVTRDLSVRYLRPVLLEAPATLRAWLERREGRRLSMAASLEQQGRTRATSRALFVEVSLSRLMNGGAGLD